MKARTRYMSILLGCWRIFAAPAQSKGAKIFKVFVVIEAVSFVLTVLLPKAGYPHLSLRYFSGVSGALMDVVAWYMVLWYVRERDNLRVLLKARDSANAGERS
jgi:succinate-acetate transporter protein